MKWRNLFLLFGLCTLTSFGWSQEFRATLTGRVTDPSGAVVPKAVVTVTNTATGVKVTTKSDQGGESC